MNLMNSDKRTRSVNWDENEKRLLVDYVKKHITILENVRPDTDTNKKKKVIWQMIEDKLRDNGYSRDAARIKEQWRRLKAYAKRNIMKYRQQVENCDDPASIQEPSIIDYEIWELIPHECNEDDNNLSDSNSSLHPNKKRKRQNDSDFESDSSWTQLETSLPPPSTNTEPQNVNKPQFPTINLFSSILNTTETESSTPRENNTRIKEEIEEVEAQEDMDPESEHFDHIDVPEDESQDMQEALNDETNEITNDMLLPDELNFSMKLPPLHKIIQEPIAQQPHRTMNNLITPINMLEPIDKTKTSLENEILILKKRLLEANLERLETKSKLDIEFHQHKMKLENMIAKKRLEHEEEFHKLQVQLERRYYKRRMEFMAIGMI